MYLLFDVLETAQLAEKEINRNASYPIVGRNAKTKQLEPNKQQTIRWAETQQDKNNKWFIPKPSIELMLGVKNYQEISTIELFNMM